MADEELKNLNKMRKQKITPLIFDSYLAVIKNSIGSELFRNFYVRVNGERTDIMQNGVFSCAFYVSSVLTLFKLAGEIHGTVDATVRDLQKRGWRSVKKPKVGDVLVWEKLNFGDNDVHKHIGFYIGDNQAISNNYTLGYPQKHHWTFGGKRKVELLFHHPKYRYPRLYSRGAIRSQAVLVQHLPRPVAEHSV